QAYWPAAQIYWPLDLAHRPAPPPRRQGKTRPPRRCCPVTDFALHRRATTATTCRPAPGAPAPAPQRRAGAMGASAPPLRRGEAKCGECPAAPKRSPLRLQPLQHQHGRALAAEVRRRPARPHGEVQLALLDLVVPRLALVGALGDQLDRVRPLLRVELHLERLLARDVRCPRQLVAVERVGRPRP